MYMTLWKRPLVRHFGIPSDTIDVITCCGTGCETTWTKKKTFNFKMININSCSYKSSRPEVFCRKGVLRNFAKFTERYLRQSLRPATLLKKRVWHSCFPLNFEKFLRTLFSQNTSGGLLLLLEFFFLKAFATLRHYKEKWKLRENCLYSELFWSTFSLI